MNTQSGATTWQPWSRARRYSLFRSLARPRNTRWVTAGVMLQAAAPPSCSTHWCTSSACACSFLATATTTPASTRLSAPPSSALAELSSSRRAFLLTWSPMFFQLLPCFWYFSSMISSKDLLSRATTGTPRASKLSRYSSCFFFVNATSFNFPSTSFKEFNLADLLRRNASGSWLRYLSIWLISISDSSCLGSPSSTFL